MAVNGGACCNRSCLTRGRERLREIEGPICDDGPVDIVGAGGGEKQHQRSRAERRRPRTDGLVAPGTPDLSCECWGKRKRRWSRANVSIGTSRQCIAAGSYRKIRTEASLPLISLSTLLRGNTFSRIDCGPIHKAIIPQRDSRAINPSKASTSTISIRGSMPRAW